MIKKNPLQIVIFLFLCVIPKRLKLKVFQTVDLLYLQGCYRLVVNFIVENMTKLGIGILGVASIHILGLVLTCVLAKNLNKAEYQEIG